MKHFTSRVLMVVIGLLVSVVVRATTVVTIDGIKYQLNGIEAYVSGCDDSVTELNIPGTIEYNGQTFKVTKILERACEDKNITSLRAESDNLTYVGSCAFSGCSSLKSIYLVGVKGIYPYAFDGCTMLQNAYLGTKLEYFGTTAGYYPSSWAFRNCTSLTYIVLPQTYKYDVNCTETVFDGCDLLQYIIYLAHNTRNLGSNAQVLNVEDFITWSENTFTYTGNAPSPTFTNNMPVGFQPTSYTMTELHKDSGTYTDSIPFTFQNEDMSFDVKIPYTYTINKAALSAKVRNATRAYGENNPAFKVDYSGFVNGENENVLDSKGIFNCSATSSSDVGEYPVTLTNISAKNYDITKANGTLTVTKAQLSAQPNNAERLYGESNPSFTIKYTGLKNNESEPKWITKPSVETTATRYSEVGTYPITIVGGEPKNYELKCTDGVLTINKAELKITANNASRLYYEDNPELTCYFDGFVNDEDKSVLTLQPVVSTQATKTSDAGTYPITVSNANAKNYRINFVSGILTVNKRKLTVSTDNYTRTYLEDNPTFTLQYSGFVNNETENDLLLKPNASTTATKQSDAGTYNIDISGGASNNYDFYYNGGKLTIEKAYQTLIWDQDLTNLQQYSQIELEATSTSGLPISYYVESDTDCSVITIGTKKYLDCFGTGETVIYAIQEGNRNYYQTTKMYKPVKVLSVTGISGVSYGSGKVRISGGKVYVNGLATNATVSIYTTAGATVYSGSDAEITLPKGSYILRIGNWSKKFVVW